jgi:hypothetical protein
MKGSTTALATEGSLQCSMKTFRSLVHDNTQFRATSRANEESWLESTLCVCVCVCVCVYGVVQLTHIDFFVVVFS